MNLIESFVKNPIKIAVGVLLVVLFGFVSLYRMPMQLTPEVQLPTLTIETRWPGASPQEVEREIVQEQEEQLKSVEGVTKMTSECLDSVGRITLEFSIETNMNEALLLVNSRLQQVPNYPVDADQPTISTSNSSDRPIAWIVLSERPPDPEAIRNFISEHPELKDELHSVLRTPNPGLASLRLDQVAEKHPEVQGLLPKEVDVAGLQKFAEDFIEARFERVPGVSNSNVFGGREEDLQVIVDPQKLAARHITIQDLRRALLERNRDTSGGDFWEGKRRWVVRTLGQFDSPEEVLDLVINKIDGKPVYVRDVADVRIGHKKPSSVVRRFGHSVIAINCLRESGANVLEVMAGIREAIRDLNENLLQTRDLCLTQVYDETDYIYSSLDLVKNNIIIGGILTVIALLLFLRSGRSTIVIALAIPTSIIGTFLFMAVAGRSLNVISLAGLAFAVGMLVDNAVVVLENIYRHAQMGKHPFTAAIKATQEVGGAIVASTLTTLSVFIPVLFIQEEAGQLFRDIALAISAAVGLSLIVSSTVIPPAAARILRRVEKKHAPAGIKQHANEFHRIWDHSFKIPGRLLDWAGNLFVNHVVRVNARVQRSLIYQLLIILVFVGGTLALSLFMIPKVEYLPTGNRNLVFGILLPPPGYNLDKLQEIGKQIEQDLKPYWDVDPDDPEAAKLKYPIIGDFFYVTANRQVFLGLRARDPERARELVPMVQEIASNIPGTFAIAKQSSLFEQGLTGGRTIDIEITGPELSNLVVLGGQIMRQVRQILPEAQAFPRPSLDLSSPEVHVIPYWEKAADMQVNAYDLGYTVDALVDGAYAADYFKGGDKIDLSIIGNQNFVENTQDLNDLPVTTPNGDLIPLSAVAKVVIGSGPEQINRRERERTITIQVSPPESVALENAMLRIRSDIVAPLAASGQLSGGYRINLSGTTDKLLSTWNALRFNFLLALLITYLLMAALFESWLYPFVIILTVPLGAIGGLAGLMLINFWLNPYGIFQPLDVITMLGFIILIGTVVNNPILIVHQSLNHMREEKMDIEKAILSSIRNRIRPIFMTTTTTLFGLLPLVLFPGAGSELYRGLGSVVLGGLLISTLFTLLLVPTVFLLAMNTKTALMRLFGIKPAEPIEESA